MQELTIGKYTLESLTNGMYASPLDLYREYIQNAVDSIDDAKESSSFNSEKYYIDITIDPENQSIIIFDNSKGIPRKKAVKTLVDVGNSKKNRNKSRGFRGIGRLAGLGYCERLVFTTSYLDESVASVVSFDAKKLEELLLSDSSAAESVNDVLGQVIETKQISEKSKRHYFKVELIGVTNSDKLLDLEVVENYLIQHAPLRYAKEFKWQRTITEKIKALGYVIPSYDIRLNNLPLYKPYEDAFVSDRVKRNEDSIKDVEVVPFYRNKKLSAVLWCAKTNYFGTILNNSIKGIRIRQGNILIGDKMSCSSFFKEERFNGWLIGEIHVINEGLIANARRDDFEKNEAYYAFVENVKEWSSIQTHEIRKLSYERSLSTEKKAVIEAEDFSDVNDLLDESIDLDECYGESDLLDQAESENVAEVDYIGKLSALINQKKFQTKYRALNINLKLTVDQRKVLERVFDLIVSAYDKKQAESFINVISSNF